MFGLIPLLLDWYNVVFRWFRLLFPSFSVVFFLFLVCGHSSASFFWDYNFFLMSAILIKIFVMECVVCIGCGRKEEERITRCWSCSWSLDCVWKVLDLVADENDGSA